MSERWSYPDEVCEVLTDSSKVRNVGGPVLQQVYGRNMIYGGDGHSVILGASGTGKTSCMTLSLVRDLARAKESMIVADPKGDLHRAVDCYLKGYRKIVFDFRNFFRSRHWNPLELIAYMLTSGIPELESEGMKYLEDLSIAVLPDGDKNDPFWINSARDVFIAMAQLLIRHARPEEVTIASIFKAIIDGDNRQGMGKKILQSFLDEFENGSGLAADQLHSYINTANDTRAGIRSTFQQCLAPFVRSEALLSFLSSEDSVKIHELTDDVPTAIFVILDDQSSAYDRISSVLLGQLIQHYISYATSQPDGRLRVRMNIVLEELGNIGSCLKDLDRWMSAARSRNVRLHLVLQAYSQLDNLYGSSKATTIRDNVKVVVAFSVNNLQTMQELSAVCGEKEDPETGRTKPLITPARLRALRVGEALILVEGHIKYVKKLPFYQQAFDCSDWKEPEVREPKYLMRPALFDMKGLVEEKEKERVAKALEEMNGRAVQQEWDLTGPARGVEQPAVDLDDLMARIDKKIAELEEEERQAEKDKKEKDQKKTEPQTKKDGGSHETVIYEVRIGEVGSRYREILNILLEYGVPGPIARFRLSKEKPKIPCHTAARAERMAEALQKIGVSAVVVRIPDPFGCA